MQGHAIGCKDHRESIAFQKQPPGVGNVLKSEVWEMDAVRTNIFPILALSYNELHPAVKRCFSYCAIFPKDSNIYATDLIRIWMAQGFLHSSGTSGDMELRGREYFKDLAMRSFFQDFRRQDLATRSFFQDFRRQDLAIRYFFQDLGVNGIICCKMHDLVHDFAQFLTNNECLIADKIDVRVKDVRHLNLHNFEETTTMDMLSHLQIEKSCSFICNGKGIPQTLFKHLKRVKLLKLSACELKDVPTEIGNLIHLRFLDLSKNILLEKLPKSVCDLYNLQTLDLRRCMRLSGLPHGIHRLVNLRHLFVEGSSPYFEFTQGLEKLVDLRRLDSFNCERGRCNNKLGYLKDLNFLGGYLKIFIADMDDRRDNVVDAENANLKDKEFIEHLTLDCKPNVGVSVIDALRPSPNLCGLNFMGSYFPNWITRLINLRELSIEGEGKEMDVLDSLRNLPFLEHLTLNGLEMEHLRVGFFVLNTTKSSSAFPNLLTFGLYSCKRLREWEDIGEENENIISVLPRLQSLRIYNCGELKALPHRLLRKTALSLQKLVIVACGYLLERYDTERGEDRDEISQIPEVYVF